jgi:phage tail sheath protein FI
MPEYLAPGVYIEEVSTGPRPIEGVSTSTTAMLGQTERGPEAPRLVTSWLEYQRWYGGYLPIEQSYLPYAVEGFFMNGGSRLYVGRIIATDATFAGRDVSDLHIQAVGRGTWGNRVYVRITGGSKRTADSAPLFRMDILYYGPDVDLPDPDNIVDPLDSAQASNPDRREPDRVESYDNLIHTAGAANNVETIVNTGSQLVRVWFTADPTTEVPIDDVDTFTRLPEADAVAGTPVDETHFPGDMNPIVASANPKVSQMYGRGRGLAAVAAIDEVSLLLAPDEVRFDPDSLTTDIINQCEQLKDRFAIVSAPQGQNDTGPVRPPFDTSYAAYYYPWIEVYDPVTRSQIRIPPTGHVAGIVARTDIERGVHKAPANEVVRGAADLEFAVTKGMQDILNPRGVNCVRDFRADGRGIRLWGARTMSSDPQWKYVNVRRLFLFVEESIDEGTQWVVFEPNDEPLWAQVRRSITNFLIRVWRSGALMGLTQEEAFFVKCDRTTMTQDDIDNGRLVCYIGIAPVKPAEFVIFRISQKTLEATA